MFDMVGNYGSQNEYAAGPHAEYVCIKISYFVASRRKIYALCAFCIECHACAEEHNHEKEYHFVNETCIIGAQTQVCQGRIWEKQEEMHDFVVTAYLLEQFQPFSCFADNLGLAHKTYFADDVDV